jgi:hypothetical protein
MDLCGREGEAPAEPHAREEGDLELAAQPELRPPTLSGRMAGDRSRSLFLRNSLAALQWPDPLDVPRSCYCRIGGE